MTRACVLPTSLSLARELPHTSKSWILTAFATDLKTQDAVIRQFEIIGEAVKGLPQDLTAKDPSIPWTQIAGFRDVLAHSYFAVDTSVIWDAASTKGPALKVSCERLLSLLQ